MADEAAPVAPDQEPNVFVGPTPSTPPVPETETVEADSKLTNEHDRIVMASRRVDGSINETNPEFIGPVEDAIRGAAHQKDLQARAAQSTDSWLKNTANKVEDAAVEADDIAKKALKDAEAEVKKLHGGYNS